MWLGIQFQSVNNDDGPQMGSRFEERRKRLVELLLEEESSISLTLGSVGVKCYSYYSWKIYHISLGLSIQHQHQQSPYHATTRLFLSPGGINKIFSSTALLPLCIVNGFVKMTTRQMMMMTTLYWRDLWPVCGGAFWKGGLRCFVDLAGVFVVLPVHSPLCQSWSEWPFCWHF